MNSLGGIHVCDICRHIADIAYNFQFHYIVLEMLLFKRFDNEEICGLFLTLQIKRVLKGIYKSRN